MSPARFFLVGLLGLSLGCDQSEPTVTLPVEVRQFKEVSILDLLDNALDATRFISWDPVSGCAEGSYFDSKTEEVVYGVGCPKDEAERKEFLRRVEFPHVAVDLD